MSPSIDVGGSPGPATGSAPTPASSPSAPAGPPSLPAAHVEIEPGTYRWTRFEPAIDLNVDAGWQVGHRHDEYFDLFRGVTFPAIGFGRFTEVYAGPTRRVAATDAAVVVAALDSNPSVEVEEVGPAELAGLEGRTIDVRVSAEQTHLFRGENDFNSDPGFVTRYHVLDLPDTGVLLVSVTAIDRELDGAMELAEPILEGLRLAD